MSSAHQSYQSLTAHLNELAVLRSCSALLGWDEQTYLPHAGAEHRANQLSLLAGLQHDRAVDVRIKDWLSDLESFECAETESEEAAVIRDARRSYVRSTRLSKQLVQELTRVATLGQQAWVEARKTKDFKRFEPLLTQMVKLKREEAQAQGAESGNLYDALLEDYEPGATSAQISDVFLTLRERLVTLVREISQSHVKPDLSILTRRYPVDLQSRLGQEAAKLIGFDFNAGRLDVTAHPFCTGIGPGDCRITTRYDEHHFSGSLFGTLHEAGHGIYEQGLRKDRFGLATGDSCSLGIHESQSRLWENLVGRSAAFWEFFYPRTQKLFSDALSDTSLEDFYLAINDVRPSWIRVEADEVTYNLHIMLRFEIEQQLISGSLEVKDLPEVWNQTFQEYFGMSPPDDSLGCLQDVHWSAGLFGYFPTYSLGNMFASQLYEKADQDLGGIEGLVRKGEFQPLKTWLNEKVHSVGRLYSAPELVQKITGEPLSSEPLLRHLTGKFGAIYQLS